MTLPEHTETANTISKSNLTQLVIPGAEPGHGWSREDIAQMILAMLFVTPEPVSINELAASAELDPEEIRQGLEDLESGSGGLLVQHHGDRVNLATNPRFARHVRQLLGLEREARLSSAALETLAIIAYRQPVTRSEIEAVRGVDCSGVIATLHARSLVEPVSRRATIGNPIQYGTTSEFLGHFGLSSLAQLPALGQINGQDGHETLRAAIETSVSDRDGDSETIGDSSPSGRP